jgi:D-amino-acid dehydrogenase
MLRRMSATSSVIVLGAGIVGTCTALHLQQRGFEVILIDKGAPGQETSFGNSCLIQQESVEPYAFPRSMSELVRIALGRGADVHWHANALPGLLKPLWQYYQNSAIGKHAAITQQYSHLIAHATSEHAPLIAATDSEDLVRREGFRFIYRTEAAFTEGIVRAQRLQRDYGVRHSVLDGAALAAAEPALLQTLAGAIHWLDPWKITAPGELVQRYAVLFTARGGQIIKAHVQQLQQQGAGWQVQTSAGSYDAALAVVAMGPWSHEFVKTLGYDLPVFIKRGYHQHFQQPKNLKLALLDAEKGYVMIPMKYGIRLTTGAEFAHINAAPTPVQLQKTQRLAHELIGLDEPAATAPWLGARPCTADMLPIMGPAPKHAGLWFNFGHGHQGFTLGPMAGRLVAQMMRGEATLVNPAPYLPARFASTF